ncbi:MAG TPA: hypothetical protein VJM46_05280 [Candidatus Saccharimonadales bacterium]|nr:hypothetical protein [Candidatus Saccharimonadales bacterium]
MTTKKFAVKKLLLSGFAVATLSLSTGAFASVSATSDNGHGNGHGNGNSHNNGGNNNGGGSTPSVGGVTLGVQQRTNVGANHSNGNGQNGGSGYGGTNVDVDNNVWVQIGNVVGGAVNITINFVNNIFS